MLRLIWLIIQIFLTWGVTLYLAMFILFSLGYFRDLQDFPGVFLWMILWPILSGMGTWWWISEYKNKKTKNSVPRNSRINNHHDWNIMMILLTWVVTLYVGEIVLNILPGTHHDDEYVFFFYSITLWPILGGLGTWGILHWHAKRH
ncbi:hypothetical protein KS4_27820 [Poriferisphaera corsica]|uniref:Uncharacterized protein n=1 Tax=Poriferisphaera corsica TaxID=2528020 RepID=A0A517YWU7_9BACT|nr:hypothetical protein [Poriferisphaera corsica]QDU34708.1 hypothetical protein KS4_27820 [Poriferisphaera corsica]